MKYLLLLCSLAIVNSLIAQEIPGLVARWKMNSDCELIDESATSPANGALIDVSLTSDRAGTANTALAFNSNTSYITLGVVEKLKLAEDKSISFWIRPVLSGSNMTGSIFKYGTGIIIRYEEQGAVTRLNVIFGNTSYMQVNLAQNEWQLVTITFKKDFNSTRSKAIAYIDGVEAAASEQNKTAHDFNNSIALIGLANQNTPTSGFRGSLDDLRIYDRVLTSAEVQNLVLPAKLQFFKGQRINGAVQLNWKTLLEENVSHFYLQKSLDGIHFQRINKIDAGKYNYLAYDPAGVLSFMAWYRLQIVDIDGRTEVSNVIWVSADDSADGSAIKLFPNPGSQYINLVGIRDNGSLTIVNSSGAIVKQKQFLARNAVDVSGLTPGLYYLIFFDGKKRMTSKFIKR